MSEICVAPTSESATLAFCIEGDSGFKNKAYVALAGYILALPVAGTSVDAAYSTMEKKVLAVGNLTFKTGKKLIEMLYNPMVLTGHELSGGLNGGLPEYKGKLYLQNNTHNRGLMKTLRNQMGAVILTERNQSTKNQLLGYTENDVSFYVKFDEMEDQFGTQVGDEKFIKIGYTFTGNYPIAYTGTLQLTAAA